MARENIEVRGCWRIAHGECPICKKKFSVKTKRQGQSIAWLRGHITRHLRAYHPEKKEE